MDNEYNTWMQDQTPENMASVVKSLEPTLVAEVQNYPGHKPLLRSMAKSLAIKAVHTYDPTRGAKLRSWVITQLKPLARYNQQLRPVHASEMAVRQAAEINRVNNELSDQLGRTPTPVELSDKTGLSTKKITYIRRQVKPSIAESYFAAGTENGKELPGVIAPDILSTARDVVYESLLPRDKAIYNWKIGAHGKAVISNQDIAKRLGVTPALVSQRSQQIANQINDVCQRKLV